MHLRYATTGVGKPLTTQHAVHMCTPPALGLLLAIMQHSAMYLVTKLTVMPVTPPLTVTARLAAASAIGF
jgi:hypothetical protein